MKRLYSLLSICLILSACGGGGGSSSTGSSSSGSYTISQGVAQKGPLQIGSTVTIAELDENLNPNGKIYLTEVADNLGNFRLGSVIGTRLALILAQGFFMDENTGDFTSASITLRGISDLSVETSPSVNVLTTLQYIRLKNLVASGKTYKEAYDQSQTEVLSAFGISPTKISNMGSLYQMKINGTSDADAVLLAISATLSKAAAMRNGSSTAAQLSDIINTIASDLSQTGRITTSSIRAELTAAQIALDIPGVRNNVQNFYLARGISITAPVFEDWISKDGTSTLPNRTRVTPSQFSFVDTINARPEISYTSQEVTVAGLEPDSYATVSVNSGSVIVKNSVPISGLNSIAKNGDKIAIRATSAAYGSAVTSTLSIGATSANWRLVTQAPASVNPNTFSLNTINNSVPNQSYTSNAITISGLNEGEVAYVISTNGSTINLNGVSSGSNFTIGQNGDTVSLSAVGPAYGSTATYTLSVGLRSANWSLVAQTPTLVSPSAFTFTSTTNEINQLVTSNTITVSGLRTGEVAQANISLFGDLPNGASLLVNGALVTQLPTIVNQGDQLAIRTTLSNKFGSTGTVSVTIGTTTSNWTVGTRRPVANYYTRFGNTNALIQDRYTSGTTYTYYAIPFIPTSSFSLRYFAVGVYNGNTDQVYLYSNNAGTNSPGSLLATATLGSTFTDSSSYTYPNGPYTSSSTSTTYTDSSGNIYWLSSKIQGKFGSGISLTGNTRYWIVIKWNNAFPHDERVDDSYKNGLLNTTFDFSQAKASNDSISWTNIQILGGGGAVPAMFMTD